MPPSIGVILNPNSRKNRRDPRARAERLRALLDGVGEVRVTRDMEDLARALDELKEAEVLVTDGGDGALHCALNGLLELGVEPEALPALFPTNGGTIDFVAKKVGIRGDGTERIAGLARALRRGGPAPSAEVDTLLIQGERGLIQGERGLNQGERGEGDAPFRKLGFATAVGGVGQRFFDKYYEDPRPTAVTIPKVIVKTLAGVALGALPVVEAPRELREHAEHLFRPTRARVRIDGELLPAETHRTLHAGAFDVDLGGFIRLFPLAAKPGALHFTAGFVTVTEAVKNLPSLIAGGAIRGRTIKDSVGRVMEVEALDGETLDPIIDGELYPGLRTLSIRRGPRIRIATG